MHDRHQSTFSAAATGDGELPGAAGLAPSLAQRTLRHAISCVGVGRHSGARVGLTLQPAAADTGICFRRSDRPGAARIKARPEQLGVAEHAMVLAAEDRTRIVGIEHVVAALAMTGIDNALIEVSGPELPAMDGSAQPFVFLIECAGAAEQDAARVACPPPASVDLRQGDAMARIAPSAAPHLAAEISGGCHIGNGPLRHAVALRRETLRHELAAARQPLTVAELETAQRRGLMRGVSLDNTLILGETRPLNAGGLRFADEVARHANVLALAALALLGGLPPVELRSRGAGPALLARLLRQCGAAAGGVAAIPGDGLATTGKATGADAGRRALGPA